MKKDIIIGSVLILIMFLLSGGMLYLNYWANEVAEYDLVETKCYDRYGNEIINVVCEEKVYYDAYVEYIMFFGFFGSLLLTCAIICLTIFISNLFGVWDDG